MYKYNSFFGGRVAEADRYVFKEVVRDLVFDISLRVKYASRGQEFLQTHCLPEVVAKRVLEVYQSC